MTDQWTRFEASASRTNSALGAQTIDVFEPTEEWQSSGGWDVTYPDTPTDSAEGECVPPESDPAIDESGTSTTADLGVYVASDSGVAWTDYGESGEAATRIEIAGTMYEVEAVDPQFDGRDRLSCVEVDT